MIEEQVLPINSTVQLFIAVNESDSGAAAITLSVIFSLATDSGHKCAGDRAGTKHYRY